MGSFDPSACLCLAYALHFILRYLVSVEGDHQSIFPFQKDAL